MRGDLYRLTAPRDVQGHEQRGARYAVVVQSDAVQLSTVLVTPTSTGSFPAVFHPEIEVDGARSVVLVEQATAFAPERLGTFAGRLKALEVAAIDDALRTVFGLF
ncbi:MAG: type II toxin-antitoxin system PemK/MazF family toxin [Propioniciclava sp.]